jgi:predicted phage terminase large subunit-like protein
MTDQTPDFMSLVKNQNLRRALVRENHKIFFSVYFHAYMKYPFAQFQHEMFDLSEDDKLKLLIIMAFRGSGKSTIMNTSLAIWSVLGKHQKKFVLILSETKEQASNHMKNLKVVLEENELLNADLGGFKEEDESWNANTLVIPKYDARITIASADQAVRGMRNKEHRPDLIIVDDIESSRSVKTKESRDKKDDWFAKEIAPIGDLDTKIIMLGNQLHQDSLLLRLRDRIDNGEMNGAYKTFPFWDDDLNCLWPEKFSTPESIEEERKKAGRPDVFASEWLLKLLDRPDQIIKKDWIKYYDHEPQMKEVIKVEHSGYGIPRRSKVKVLNKKTNNLSAEPSNDLQYRGGIIVGIDPAVSQGPRSDYTAMVACRVFGTGSKMRIYVLPHIVNAKLSFEGIVGAAKNFTHKYPNDNIDFVVECVAAQDYLRQEMENRGLPVRRLESGKMNKAERLIAAGPYFERGQILFPKGHSARLVEQILGFGMENKDDLVDALTAMILRVNQIWPYSSDSHSRVNTGPNIGIAGNVWAKQY